MAAESIAIVGPTASGKTRRAVEVARALNGEVISADSRQFYRGMDLGTGKDLAEYEEIPYHLIDIRPAGYKYNLHEYLRDFHTVYSDVLLRGRIPVICGGSGMYVENAVRGIRLPDVPCNEELRTRLQERSLQELAEILSGYTALHNTTDIDSKARAIRAIEIQQYYRDHPEKAAKTTNDGATPLDSLVIGVDIPRDKRRERITARLHQRLEEGMVEEIHRLLDSGVSADDLMYYGLEYKYVTLYVIGEMDYDRMVKELEIAIHQFAKRQMTWFRGMERRGTKIHWLPYDMTTEEFTGEVKRMMGAM